MQALRQTLSNTISTQAAVACLLLAVPGCQKEEYGDWPELAICRSLGHGTSKPLFAVRVDGLLGLIDISGKLVVTPQFENIREFTEGVAAALKNRRWGYIDEDGAWVIEPRFASAGPFSSERATVTLTSGSKVGYIDKKGNLVISPQFDCSGLFVDGIARVGTRTLGSHIKSSFADVGMSCNYWFIDDAGNPVDRPSEALLRERLETKKPDKVAVTRFKQEGKFGLKDKLGRIILEPQFAYIAPFRRGLAIVTLASGDEGYVNTTGRVVWKPTQ